MAVTMKTKMGIVDRRSSYISGGKADCCCCSESQVEISLLFSILLRMGYLLKFAFW